MTLKSVKSKMYEKWNMLTESKEFVLYNVWYTLMALLGKRHGLKFETYLYHDLDIKAGWVKNAEESGYFKER